jgi:hypothetical protein
VYSAAPNTVWRVDEMKVKTEVKSGALNAYLTVKGETQGAIKGD